MKTATAALRLLLEDPHLDPDHLDWTHLRRVAEAERVIVRLADRLTGRGETVPPVFGAAAVRARARAERLVMVVAQVSDACRRHGVPHAFLKVAERYPDSGRDLDLLVAPRSPDVDRLILRDLPVAPQRRSWRGRLTGAATYVIAGDLVLDVHHGRLGQFGEHARYAQGLLQRVRAVPLAGTGCPAPPPEDHLLLLAMNQVYTRPAFRLGDVYWTLATLRERVFAWSDLVPMARTIGILPALLSYVEHVDEVHRRVFSEAPPLRFPRPRLVGRVYLRQVRHALTTHDWASAARLSCLPVVALASGVRRLAPHHRRPSR